MKKWLLAAAVCVLTACSSGGESKTYYQLPVAQGGVRAIPVIGSVYGGAKTFSETVPVLTRDDLFRSTIELPAPVLGTGKRIRDSRSNPSYS